LTYSDTKFEVFCKFFKENCYIYTKNNNIMGRGDKRTRKGKITLGSFGKSRPARAAKKVTAVAEKKAE